MPLAAAFRDGVRCTSPRDVPWKSHVHCFIDMTWAPPSTSCQSTVTLVVLLFALQVWIEKLLEPYACNAEFVVHVASLCAMPELAPKKPQEEQGINCQEQTTKNPAMKKHTLELKSSKTGMRNPSQEVSGSSGWSRIAIELSLFPNA